MRLERLIKAKSRRIFVHYYREEAFCDSPLTVKLTVRKGTL